MARKPAANLPATMAIREALPERLREQFIEEIGDAADEAIEHNDRAILDRVKKRWWAKAQALAADASGLEVKPGDNEPMRGFLVPADDERDEPPDDSAPAFV